MVYDAGGPADGSHVRRHHWTPCGSSTIAQFLANTARADSAAHQPAGAGRGLLRQRGLHRLRRSRTRAAAPAARAVSTGRIDPPLGSERRLAGLLGTELASSNSARSPYAAGENGGIHGHVVYASTRPFDDPQLLLQTQLGAAGPARHHQPLPRRARRRTASRSP